MSNKIIFTFFNVTSALTLHYFFSPFLSEVLCSSGCLQGPPPPNKPFITVWITPIRINVNQNGILFRSECI